MKFLVISHRGSEIVPADHEQNNAQRWGEWMDKLNEVSGLRIKGGQTVAGSGVTEYGGDSAGVSIIETQSIQEAIEWIKTCPGLPYGWAFDVLHD
jgi:hypothetical protein